MKIYIDFKKGEKAFYIVFYDDKGRYLDSSRPYRGMRALNKDYKALLKLNFIDELERLLDMME